MHVNDLLKLAVESGASDLHLKVGSYPMLRVRGVLVPALSDKRLDHETPNKTVVSLDPLSCPCSTMFRIDAAHLCWTLEQLVEGRVVNRITVDEETAADARIALDRMLAIT